MPLLPPDSLIVSLDKLSKLPIDPASKRVLSDILRSASNPANERIDVVVRTLPPDRRKNVERTSRKLAAVTRGITQRGRAGLEDMSDGEFQKLIDESNAG